MITESVKKIIDGYIGNIDLSNIEVAEVLSVNPICIKLDDITEPLDSSFVVVPERLIKNTYKVLIDDSLNEYKLTFVGNELKKGDKVSVIKAKGGQKYYILDKVV